MDSEREKDIEAVSVLPGRVRWRVPLLRDAPSLAAELATELRAIPHVIDVTTNAATAGVLVLFDAQRSFDSVAEVVRERVQILAVRFPQPPRG